MNIDKMTPAEIDHYWKGKPQAEFLRCSAIVRGFVGNPANRDLMRQCRPGMIGKTAVAVGEGLKLTRESWCSLFGYGPEYPSSFQASK